MAIKTFRRFLRGGVSAFVTATLGLSFAVIPQASPASASVNNNCGYVTCTLYLDKQSTRALKSVFSNDWENLAESVAIGLACTVITSNPVAGFGCGVLTAAGSFAIKYATTSAVSIDGCLTIKYGIGSNLKAKAELGASNNPSYCRAGVPLFPDGTLVKQASSPYVYVVYGGAKFLIPNPEAFAALGFSWSAIRTISDEDFKLIPRLPAYGTILRELTLPTVYRIENGRKRAVALSEYLGNGYGSYLHYVPDGQLVPISNV